MKENKNIKNINEYKKRKKNSNKNRNRRSIIIKCISVGCILLLLIGYLYGNSVVTSLKYKVNSLNKSLREKEISLEEVKSKVEEKTSIRELEKKAKEELDMDYPKKNQIVHIEVGK